MRAAMAAAEVGDDVYGEDPTVNRLEQRAAEIFEREAAMFVPTGTMGNQIAIRLHTQHGQEVICEARSHVVEWEMAMISAFSGCMPRTIVGDRGVLTWKQIQAAIAPSLYYRAQTGLITLENTHNMAGGTVTPLAVLQEIWAGAKDAGLPLHLDGARIFNAATYLACRRCGTDPRLRYGHVLLVERTVRPGRLHAGGLARTDASRKNHSQVAGRRHAAGGRAGGGGSGVAGNHDRRDWKKTIAMLGCWRNRWPRFPG